MNFFNWLFDLTSLTVTGGTVTQSSTVKTTGAVSYTASATSAGINLSNNITYRHKFVTKGRTLSLSVNADDNYKYPKWKIETDSLNRITNSLDRYTFQERNDESKGYSLSSRIMYTEPLGQKSLLQINYNSNLSHNESDKLTSNLLLPNNPIDTLLSNTYKSDYLTNSAGLGYRIQTQDFNGSFTLNYQLAELTGSTEFPAKSNINRTYNNWLPTSLPET